MTYIKEYDEALSRLNAPERSPLPYAPIPYGPVPNKCNYAHWNRVMAETRQGTLPKYSILQRIDLGNQNDLVHPSNEVEYVYTLDPSFTFANGARKSIAIRKVDIYNVIPHDQTVQAHERLFGRFRMEFSKKADDDTWVDPFTEDIWLESDLVYNCSNDKVVSLNCFAQELAKMLYRRICEKESLVGYISGLVYGAYEEDNNRIRITIFPNYETMRFVNITTIGNPTWMIAQSSIYNYYNTDNDDPMIFRCNKDRNQNAFNIYLPLPENILDIRRTSVCSSINPWTKNNLLAPLQYDSDTLTKVFPYNGNPEARFWFINEKGEKIRWRWVRGYIDLELIVDNTDSYAMDH